MFYTLRVGRRLITTTCKHWNGSGISEPYIKCTASLKYSCLFQGRPIAGPKPFSANKFSLFFFKDFIYLLLERGEGREKERERNISVWLPLACPLLGTWPATQVGALPGNRTGNFSVRKPTLNPLSHTSQGNNFFNLIETLIKINDTLH